MNNYFCYIGKTYLNQQQSQTKAINPLCQNHYQSLGCQTDNVQQVGRTSTSRCQDNIDNHNYYHSLIKQTTTKRRMHDSQTNSKLHHFINTGLASQ